MASFVGINDESMVDELSQALNDDVRIVVYNAATSLIAYGDKAQPAMKGLLKRLRKSLNDCRDDDSRTFLWAIDAIAPDTIATLEDFFGETDAEYLRFSKDLLESSPRPPVETTAS